ncbi:UbiA family prenyltransferase [Halopseudomonas salina]|nr:UbiA family prenyltransferase [Halopseudomonas salina]
MKCMTGKIPLCIDLDGTLLRSDMLLESGLAFLRQYPLGVIKPFQWLHESKVKLKEELARATEIDVTVLPYDPAVLELIENARGEGREIVLATASHEILANRIAKHLQLFDKVLATNASRNLSAQSKCDLLVEHYGRGGFDYAGNSSDDICIWTAARRAYVVNPQAGVLIAARRKGNVEAVMDSGRAGIRVWFKALRIHQWLKNLLIFVPLLAAHQFDQSSLLLQGILAFVFFGLCASSVYIFNDLLDLEDDRHHSTKHARPFASGALSIKAGLLVFPALLVVAFTGAALFLPWKFVAALALYYFITLTYSLWLKQLMTIDVITLATLYTMRIIAGTAAFNLSPTFWLLAFSMFVFLSLALVKRYAELNAARSSGETEKTRGRGYFPSDLEMVASLGASSGYLSVMVLALYIHDQETTGMYTEPRLIWLACPLLLFWITRIWMLTHRGVMDDDPVVFAIRDRVSLMVGVLFGMVFWIAA